jgi:hypothetical protein
MARTPGRLCTLGNDRPGVVQLQTAKENAINPLPYLTYLFEQLPNINLKDPEALDLLLPWAEPIQEKLRIPAKPAAQPDLASRSLPVRPPSVTLAEGGRYFPLTDIPSCF